MPIKKVWLDESADECISCGNCETACPEVFEVPDKMKVKNVDFNDFEAKIKDAVNICPTAVIKYE